LHLRILTDDVEEFPTKDFEKYSELIIGMINKSSPNFSIGLYGEWGMGKTTLMKLIYKQLKYNDEYKQSIIPVWFNAWMYERENQFALYPLLQTIATSIPDNNESQKKLKEIVKKFGKGIGKGMLKSIPELQHH
jgi:predicted KAP-like P-loop ATPase